MGLDLLLFVFPVFPETFFGHKPLRDGRYGYIVVTAEASVKISIYLNMEMTKHMSAFFRNINHHLIPQIVLFQAPELRKSWGDLYQRFMKIWSDSADAYGLSIRPNYFRKVPGEKCARVTKHVPG